MRKLVSVLCVLGVLQGCGGGGGGGGGDSGGDQAPTPIYSLTAQVSGLDGTVTLVANGASPVAIESNTLVALGAFAAGTQYTVEVATQPAMQHCTVASGSGTLTANTTIAVTCVARIVATKSTVVGYEVAHFDVTGLDLQAGEYSGVIDDNVPVRLAAMDNRLVLLMPPLVDGAHRLEVLVDGVRYPIDFTSQTAPLPSTAAQITADYVTEVEDALAALKLDPNLVGMTDWAALDAEFARVKAELQTLSPEQLEALARFLWVNDISSRASSAAKYDALLHNKWNDPDCMDIHARVFGHAVDSFAYLSAMAAITAIGIEVGGPYGALVGGGISSVLFVKKAWPSISKFWATTKEYSGRQCFSFETLTFDQKIEDLLLSKPATNRIQTATQQTLTFNHTRMREYAVIGHGTLPAQLHESASLASNILRYASVFLSEDAKAALQDWTVSYTRPVDVSDFALTHVSDGRIEGTLSSVGTALRLRFAFLPNQMPNEPADFTFTLTGNNQSWQIPARLSALQAPRAFAGDVSTLVNEAVHGTLQAEFAESFRIDSPPLQGTVTLEHTSGAYVYTPNAEFTGDDSFTFVAVNERGESQPATVHIKVGGPCNFVDQGHWLQRICYVDEEKTVVDFTEELVAQPTGLVDIWRIANTVVIPGDMNSQRSHEWLKVELWDDGRFRRIQQDKNRWGVMPGTQTIVSEYTEGSEVTYDPLGGVQLRWHRNVSNLVARTMSSQSLGCSGGTYFRRASSHTLDSYGQYWDEELLLLEMDVPGPCPKSEAEVLSVLPYELEDIAVWRIWSERNGVELHR